MIYDTDSSGSSPHTWGIRFGLALLPFDIRFIPTYVGHTPVPGWRPGCRRFIPTYVGHTVAGYRQTAGRTVHPHIRGAYFFLVLGFRRCFGSSPHTWGIRYDLVFRGRWLRFIPTYVGHTPRSCSLWSPITVHPHIRGAYGVAERVQPTQSVHPHIRGAYAFKALAIYHVDGSSPHTWGILPCAMGGRSGTRFIPTYVGHTSTCTRT